MQLTQQQQAILDSITSEFKAINIVKSSQAKFNYIDVSPILSMKRLVEEEKEICKAMFSASLEAFMPLVEEKFKLLINDLSIVEGLAFKIVRNHQYIQLYIGDMSVKCTTWGVFKTLSDGDSREAYDIDPTYHINHYDGTHSQYNTFEKMISSSTFKNKIERTINNLKN